MTLSDEHIIILKDIHRFAGIQRYHELLPRKHALFYDKADIELLRDRGLIEEATVMSHCGGKLKGYKLTTDAPQRLAALGIDLEGECRIDGDGMRGFPVEELGKEHIEILSDVYHYSRIKRFAGLMPKDEMEKAHAKPHVKFLYDAGLILYIKLKSPTIKSRKGYILSELGRSVLRGAGVAC